MPQSGRRGLAVLCLGLALGFAPRPGFAADDKAKPLPPTAAAVAARQADAEHYAACMAKIDTNPKGAFDDGDGWTALGGGEPARHCAAAALLKLGFPEEAAQRLELLAVGSHQDDSLRAQMLDQAAQAWIAANDYEKADAAQSAAVRLMPQSADMLIDRARIRALAKNYGKAIDDLNAALKIRPKDREALVMRASAYRYMDAYDLALQDLDAVIATSPDFLPARLERGIVYRLQKKPDAARADWMEVLIASPDSATAEEVRRNIELLELPPPEPEKPAAGESSTPPMPVSTKKP